MEARGFIHVSFTEEGFPLEVIARIVKLSEEEVLAILEEQGI